MHVCNEDGVLSVDTGELVLFDSCQIELEAYGVRVDELVLMDTRFQRGSV